MLDAIDTSDACIVCEAGSKCDILQLPVHDYYIGVVNYKEGMIDSTNLLPCDSTDKYNCLHRIEQEAEAIKVSIQGIDAALKCYKCEAPKYTKDNLKTSYPVSNTTLDHYKNYYDYMPGKFQLKEGVFIKKYLDNPDKISVYNRKREIGYLYNGYEDILLCDMFLIHYKKYADYHYDGYYSRVYLGDITDMYEALLKEIKAGSEKMLVSINLDDQ